MGGSPWSVWWISPARKQAEKQEKEYQTKLLFLSNTALDFLGLPNEADIFKYIGTKLKEFVVRANIIVSFFDDTDQKLKVTFHSLTGDKRQNVENIIGIASE